VPSVLTTSQTQSPTATGASPLSLRLISYNVRYAATNRVKNERPWSERAPQLIAQLRFLTVHTPEVFICLQEPLYHQVIDVVHGLNEDGHFADGSPEWASLGVGRDDGNQAGEHCQILYRPAVWALVNSRTLWLSDTPDRPSRGWDAALNRILTVGVFEHRRSRRRVVAMNTHLDHRGVEARIEGAKFVMREVAAASKDSVVPTFLAGDFNSEEFEEAYRTLTAEGSPVQDLRGLVPEKKRYGCKETCTGFGQWEGPPVLIDFLFVNKQSPWKALAYAVLENKIDGLIISDHRPVIVDVVV